MTVCSGSGLPGIDQVLGQADAGVRASYGDLPVSRAFHRVGNLDLSAWHLADLIDLCTLTANDAANELPRREKKRENSMFDTKTKKKSSKCRWIKTNVLKKTTNTTATSKKNNNWNLEIWQVSSYANIRATVNLAPALEDAVDIFVPNILWMSLFGVKLDTWMTPPDQCEDMLCFPFVAYYVRSMWEHSTVFGRYYFPSQNWQCHQNLNQQSGELYMGKIVILVDISIFTEQRWDSHHLEWLARGSQSVQRHPSQLRTWQENPSEHADKVKC